MHIRTNNIALLAHCQLVLPIHPFTRPYLAHRFPNRFTIPIKTLIADSYVKADVEITVEGCDVIARLSTPDDDLITEVQISDGQTYSVSINNPLLWSAENPALYKLEMFAGEELIGEYIGIRDIKIDNGVIKVDESEQKNWYCNGFEQQGLDGNPNEVGNRYLVQLHDGKGKEQETLHHH